MNVTILIVSFKDHFPWLRYCLKSIARFATGFSQVKIMIPDTDLTAMHPLLSEFSDHKGIPIRVGVYQDWPGKGFLRHEDVIMNSDEYCPEADFICHVDSDCLFIELVTPEDYFENGKPVLMHASFTWLVTQQANLIMWKEAAEKALGFEVTQEVMRVHPAVHYRKLYRKTRECVEANTGMTCAEFIKSGHDHFPQLFAEFPTLGAVAWKYFHDDYRWRNQETEGFPPLKLTQFWGRAPVDEMQMPFVKDAKIQCTPEMLLKML